MIWFLEGQSSQRDVIAGAMDVIHGRVPVIASHRQHRPEITGAADIVLTEPHNDEDRVEWALDVAQSKGVKVMLVGRAGHVFEAHRARFEGYDIDLVTGGTSTRTFEQVDDKSVFTAAATDAGLLVIPAITIESADELAAAIEKIKLNGPVCVKPARGIYGMGFWRLDPESDPFRCFANAGSHMVNEKLFIDAYRASSNAKPLLVMPYMPGPESSVDMVVRKGKVQGYCARRKEGIFQTFTQSGPAVELAIQAAEFFGCDGIVNVQTRDDASGNPHLLEINPRYSGGIGYLRLCGINLPGLFAATRLGLPAPLAQWVDGVQIKAITSAVRVNCLQSAAH